MKLDTYFRVNSYATIACGALALVISGGIGRGLAVVFALLLILSWNLEGTPWQLSERLGLAIVLLALPFFYIDWKYLGGVSEAQSEAGVGALGHLVLFLSTVKLLQLKSSRDWIFLYIISFFEVLLAATLYVSPLFLITLGLFALCAVSTIVAFETRKSAKDLTVDQYRAASTPMPMWRRPRKKAGNETDGFLSGGRARGLPLVGVVLVTLIVGLSVPIFLVAPRYGSSVFSRAGEGVSGFVGFSDDVNLGSIGVLQRQAGVVMRVRIENSDAKKQRNLKWRGIALDEFTGNSWRRSNPDSFIQLKNERNFFPLGTTEDLHRLMLQTFFLEPIDTPILFAAARIVAIQGILPFVSGDDQGTIQTRPHEAEGISYKAYSDIVEPAADVLRGDRAIYAPQFKRFLQLPSTLDPRINLLAKEIGTSTGARNRYDMARAIESYLQSEKNYRYTLDLTVGGNDPLADFLFRVRAGHCEYFATAMAVMLRTQGIAARIVNGFQMGEYNDAANAFTVRQSDAHSWVEVYFPATGSWVAFDPTPAAGRPLHKNTGLAAALSKYAEAAELFWTQYIVGYDKQDQRSLLTSLGSGATKLGRFLGDVTADIRSFATGLLGSFRKSEKDLIRSPLPYLTLVAVVSLALSAIFLGRLKWIRPALTRLTRRGGDDRGSAIIFYRRMMDILEARGIIRSPDLTPLEFAITSGTPRVLEITKAYNRVRYGDQALSQSEQAEIENWLKCIEEERLPG